MEIIKKKIAKTTKNDQELERTRRYCEECEILGDWSLSAMNRQDGKLEVIEVNLQAIGTKMNGVESNLFELRSKRRIFREFLGVCCFCHRPSRSMVSLEPEQRKPTPPTLEAVQADRSAWPKVRSVRRSSSAGDVVQNKRFLLRNDLDHLNASLDRIISMAISLDSLLDKQNARVPHLVYTAQNLNRKASEANHLGQMLLKK